LTEVDLGDAGQPIQVEVEFLAPKEVKPKKDKPKLLQNFRVLQADGCSTAFNAPVEIELVGQTIRGADNTVRVRLASLPDFLVMKAHALAGRDKPKDAYDICYCLANFPGGLDALTAVRAARIFNVCVGLRSLPCRSGRAEQHREIQADNVRRA
jgi:predicted nucleotidyltransferase